LLRAYSLVFIRMGEPDPETAATLISRLDPCYPAASDALNRELCAMLVYLKSPTVARKTIALMQQPSPPPSAESLEELLARNRGYGGTIARVLANSADLQKLQYAFVLRNLRDGWTMDERKFYFKWLSDARQFSGGSSFQGFLNNIERDAFDNATDAERLAIEAAGLRKPYQLKELPKPHGPGREWILDDLLRLGETRLKARDYKAGQRAFAAARCIVCHRINGEGGATGPDLSQAAGRFSLKDMSEAIVLPSKVISDQYRASSVATKAGQVLTGRIVSETNGTLTVLVNPEDSTKIVELAKDQVEEVEPSPLSLMPADLLKPLNENEVLDLLAYLLSRGDANHPLFKK
jgi:putative heme-binding domain-containing protein